MSKVLLLDIENQTKKLKELSLLLSQYDQVILVYAASNLNIALDELVSLSQAIQKEQLVVIKMPSAGSDAADFGLTFIAGRLSAKLSAESCIDVMSDDKKLSYAVELLNQVGLQAHQLKQRGAEQQGIEQRGIEQQEADESDAHNTAKISTAKNTAMVQIERVENDSIHCNTPPTKPVQVQASQQQASQQELQQQEAQQKVLQRVLAKLQKNQPKKLKSLQKSLVSWCGLTQEHAEQMIMQLQQLKCISIHDAKVSYHKKALEKPNKKIKTAEVANVQATMPLNVNFTEKPHLLRIQQYSQFLIKIAKNKPNKHSTLKNSIKAFFKYTQDDPAEQLINLLHKHHLIQINQEKIIYNPEIITSWSKTS